MKIKFTPPLLFITVLLGLDVVLDSNMEASAHNDYSVNTFELPKDSSYYQIPNSDFETPWINEHEPGNGWYGYASCKGEQSSTRETAAEYTTKVKGHDSASAAQLVSYDNWISNMNSYLTTGCVNYDSFDSNEDKNYIFTDRKGDNHLLFAGVPDSITFYCKYIKSDNEKEYHGEFNLVIHGDIDYKYPFESEENEKTYKIAGTNIAITPSNDWIRYSSPIEYTNIKSDKVYLLATFSTSDKNGLTNNDTLTVDDIAFIYNSKLKKVIYGGSEIEINNGKAIVNAKYDESKLKLQSDGLGALIKKEFDANTGILKISVIGNDISINPQNLHSYEILFEDHTSTDIIKINDSISNVYDLQGRLILKDIHKSEALRKLDNGVYIFGNEKIIIDK